MERHILRQPPIVLIDQMVKWLSALRREWTSCQYVDHGPPCKMFLYERIFWGVSSFDMTFLVLWKRNTVVTSLNLFWSGNYDNKTLVF